MLLIGALAVYKVVQVIKALLPKALMPWVVVVLGVLLSVPLAFALDLDYPLLTGLAMATVAGATHSVLRLVTFLGDMAFNKSLK